MDPWVEAIAKRLGSPVFTTGDEVRFNCFREDCGSHKDDKAHMYVNPVKGKYFCQRCRRGGTLKHLAAAIGIQSPENSLTLWTRLINAFLYGTSVDEEVTAELDLPESHPVTQGTQAYEYLRERGIYDARIEEYDIRFGVGEYRNRVILPDYDEGELVYWVARSYGNHRAKYKNARAPREKLLFSLGRWKRRTPSRIVICEGPLSAIAAGYDAVATYGKHVTGGQISALVALRAPEYVVAGDGDALHEAISLTTRLWRRGCNVKLAKFEGTEDPASVGSIEARRRIKSAKPWTSLSALEVMV